MSRAGKEEGRWVKMSIFIEQFCCEVTGELISAL